MTFIRRFINQYKSMSVPVKAAFWYTVCNVMNKGLALLATPIFTRILTEEEYGAFAIFQSWVSILIIITSLNVFLGGYKKGLLLYKDDIAGFTSSQLGLTTLLTLLIASIYYIIPGFWSNILGISPHLMGAMFMELLLLPAYELWMANQQFNYKYKNAVILSLSMSFLGLGIAIIAVLLSRSKLEARVYSDAIVKAFFSCIIFIFIFTKGKVFFSKKYWRYALAFNLPLIPHYMANYILNQSDRIMIGKMVGSGQAAFYSVAYTISTMMLLVITAINNAITPFIYKSINESQAKNIKERINPIVFFVAGLTVLTTALAPEIIRVFAGEKYLDAAYAIPPISTSVYFIYIYSLFSTIEYYYQKTSRIAIATSSAAIINLILNFAGIKIFGYIAAGYTTLICYICLALFHYYFYRNILKSEKSEIKEVFGIKVIILGGITVLVCMIILTLIYNNAILRYIAILIMLSIGISKRKTIVAAIKK